MYVWREMIFVQPLFNNSHIHMCFYSLSSSFSLHCFCLITRREKWLSPKLSHISRTNITYHAWIPKGSKRLLLHQAFAQMKQHLKRKRLHHHQNYKHHPLDWVVNLYTVYISAFGRNPNPIHRVILHIWRLEHLVICNITIIKLKII